MDKLKLKIFKLFYAATLFLLAVYSYTQIDLNLTLSSNFIYQYIQKQLIYIGYYNRPLSTLFLVLLLFLLFLNYFLILKFVKNKLLKAKDIIHLLLLSVLVLIFSYPAFSYDIFNYIFDARIVVKYHQSPYNFRALDFPHDTWIRFMHWTHRTYPYGPLWLILSIPIYIFGFSKFVLVLFNFRLLFISSYLLSVYFINKILKNLNIDNRLFNLSFFAFNPLIIIDSILSPHNDSLMLLGALISIYLYIKKKKVLSFISFILSGGIKFLSWAIIPIIYFGEKVKLDFSKTLKLIFWTQAAILIPIVYLREPYPWYFIPLIGIASLIQKSEFIYFLVISLTISTLVRYLPFIYFGDYKISTQNWQLYLASASFCIPILIYILKSRKFLK